MEQDLKDELARIRAREKRYKVDAEAQIAELKEQLKTLTDAGSSASASMTELEKRCRKLEEENAALKAQAESAKKQLKTLTDAGSSESASMAELEKRCRKLEEEKAALKVQAESAAVIMGRRCKELETENARYQERCKALEHIVRRENQLRIQL